MSNNSLKFRVKDRVWSVADPEESGFVIATVNYEYSTKYLVSWAKDHIESEHYHFELTDEQYGSKN